MAIKGLKSPFKKKASPLKMEPFTAIQLGTAVLGYFGKRKARKRMAKQNRDAQARLEEMREQYMDLEFTNPYAGLQSPYENMQNQYAGLENQYAGLQNVYEGAENIYEDLRVDTRAADFARQQSQQSQANILSSLGGAAGSSGIGGLAQSLAMAGTQQAQQSAASISQQERANQMAERGQAANLQAARLGETSRLEGIQAGERARLQGLTATEAARIDEMQRSGRFQTDMLRRKGQQYVEQQEQNRIAQMYGLSADTATSTMQGLNKARADQSAAFGQMFSAFGSAYAGGEFDFLKGPSTSNLTMAPGSTLPENTLDSSTMSPTYGSNPIFTNNFGPQDNTVPIYGGGGTEVNVGGYPSYLNQSSPFSKKKK